MPTLMTAPKVAVRETIEEEEAAPHQQNEHGRPRPDGGMAEDLDPRIRAW